MDAPNELYPKQMGSFYGLSWNFYDTVSFFLSSKYYTLNLRNKAKFSSIQLCVMSKYTLLIKSEMSIFIVTA